MAAVNGRKKPRGSSPGLFRRLLLFRARLRLGQKLQGRFDEFVDNLDKVAAVCGHAAGDPVLHQSQAAAHHEGVHLFHKSRVHLGVTGLPLLHAPVVGQEHNPPHEVLVPVLAEEHGAQVPVLLHQVEDVDEQVGDGLGGEVGVKGPGDFLVQLVFDAQKQLVGAGVMGLKGPPVDVRPPAQFFHGDILNGLVAHQFQKALPQNRFGVAHAPVRPRHVRHLRHASFLALL